MSGDRRHFRSAYFKNAPRRADRDRDRRSLPCARAEATLAWSVIAALLPPLGMSNCAAKFFPGTRAAPLKPSLDVGLEAILLS
jgi:hypothetical protein